MLGLNVSEHNAKLPWVDTIESIVKIMKTGNINKKIYEERGTEVGLVAKFFNYLLNILRKEQIKLKILNTSLKESSQVDPLTGILNRRGLMEIIDGKNPYDFNITVIIIDIDKFKSINDTYGHNVGDSVLVELSSLVKERIVDEDILVRWGGEEFVVVVYTEDLNVTQNIAEELRKAIEEFEFSTVKKVTASFGVSKAKNEDESFSDIFEKADKALYDAKQLGRNRVCSW